MGNTHIVPRNSHCVLNYFIQNGIHNGFIESSKRRVFDFFGNARGRSRYILGKYSRYKIPEFRREDELRVVTGFVVEVLGVEVEATLFGLTVVFLVSFVVCSPRNF